MEADDILTGPPATIVGKTGAGEGLADIDWWEATDEQSPVESFSPDEARVQRNIWIKWDDRLRAAKAFAGFARVVVDGPPPGAGSGRRYISRMIPENYPACPWMWGTSVAPIHGVQRKVKLPNETVARWLLGKITVNYAATRYSVRADFDPLVVGLAPSPLVGLPDDGRLNRFVSRAVRRASRLVTIPTGVLYYLKDDASGLTDTNAPQGEGFPFRETMFTVTFTHHSTPEIPWNKVAAATFCVNKNPWPPGPGAYPAETLLYEGVEYVERNCPFSAELLFDAQHIFSFAPRCKRRGPDKGTPTGWNYGLRPRGGFLDYERLATIGTAATKGDPPFLPFEDFGNLFRPEQP